MSKDYKTFKKIKYYEIDKNRILCSYSIFSDKITASSGFFKKLDKNEAHFILVHEEGHKKDRKIFLSSILLSIINVIIFFYFFVKSIFIDSNFNYLFIFLLFISIYFLLLIYLYRHCEYRADEYAAKQVNYKYLISASAKYKQENYPIYIKIITKITHPSPEKRIRHVIQVVQKNL